MGALLALGLGAVSAPAAMQAASLADTQIELGHTSVGAAIAFVRGLDGWGLHAAGSAHLHGITGLEEHPAVPAAKGQRRR